MANILKVKNQQGEWIGITAIQGVVGPIGPMGPAPERGTDYWTEEDQQAIIDDILNSLPTWNGGSY